MRNIWKRTAAAVLALVLCLSLAGCYNENNTWAARKGDDTMPIGGYIYYLYSAYSEARDQVDSDTAVLDAEIDGVDHRPGAELPERLLLHQRQVQRVWPGADRGRPDPDRQHHHQLLELLPEHL